MNVKLPKPVAAIYGLMACSEFPALPKYVKSAATEKLELTRQEAAYSLSMTTVMEWIFNTGSPLETDYSCLKNNTAYWFPRIPGTPYLIQVN